MPWGIPMARARKRARSGQLQAQRQARERCPAARAVRSAASSRSHPGGSARATRRRATGTGLSSPKMRFSSSICWGVASTCVPMYISRAEPGYQADEEEDDERDPEEDGYQGEESLRDVSAHVWLRIRNRGATCRPAGSAVAGRHAQAYLCRVGQVVEAAVAHAA